MTKTSKTLAVMQGPHPAKRTLRQPVFKVSLASQQEVLFVFVKRYRVHEFSTPNTGLQPVRQFHLGFLSESESRSMLLS